MDYRDEVFLKVAQNLSFSKAANELFISQPAVTKHIKELESKYKTSLFDRRGNKIFLTKEGSLLYEELREIKARYEELEYRMGSLNNSYSGKLKIGASTTISQYVIPKIIASFLKKYPNIELSIINGNSEEIENKLLNKEIDIALVENELSHQDLKYYPYKTDEIIAVTPKKGIYGKKKQLNLQDLYQIPIIMREKGSGTLQVIQNYFKKNNFDFNKLNIALHLGTTEAIKNFLADFDGIAFLPYVSVKKEILRDELVPLKIKKIDIKRNFRIAQRMGPTPSAAKIFMEHLNAYNNKL